MPVRALIAMVLCVTTAGVADAQAPPASRVEDTISVEFEGSETFDRFVLQNAIEDQLSAIRGAGGGVGDLVDAATALERWYASQGFPDASVRLRMLDESEEDAHRTIASPEEFEEVDTVVFLISEGERLYLGRVRFQGNDAFSDDVLGRYVSRRGTEFLGTGRAVFRPDAPAAIADRIRNHYLLAGYLDVRIHEPETIRRGSRVDIAFEIDEGPRFLVGAAEVSGAAGLPSGLASSVSALVPGSGRPYTERVAADGADRIRRYLGERGYITEVRYDIEEDPEEATVAIRYEIGEVSQAVLGEIRVRSEDGDPLRTRPFVVRNRFDLEPGAPVDSTAVADGREDLYRSGLFAIVSTNLRDRNDGEMDLIVSVDEARYRYVEAAAGFGTVEQLFGSVEYVDRNLFGTGRTWALEAEGSFRGYRFSSRVVDRFLLGLSGRISVEAAHALRLRESFTERSLAADLLAESSISDEVRVGGDVELSFSRVEPAEAVSSPEQTPEQINLATLNAHGAFDNTESTLFPTDGVRVGSSAAFSTSLRGPRRRFLMLSGDAAVHRPIGERVFASAQLEGSAILPLGAAPVPITERLYAGGSDSVRSFPEETLSPVDAKGRATGGLTLLDATVEARVRIIEDLFAAVFYDIGMVAREALSLSQPGQALGGGLRYRLPVGPLRVDVAYNPGPRFAADRSWAFHISVGSGF